MGFIPEYRVVATAFNGRERLTEIIKRIVGFTALIRYSRLDGGHGV